MLGVGIAINPNDTFDDFALDGGPISDAELSPGQGLVLTVTFAPMDSAAPALRSAVLSVTTSDAAVSPVNLPLTGTARAQ